MSKSIALKTWLVMVYGADAPTIATARRWASAGKIQPAPTKHGRSYYVDPDARYTDRLTKPSRKPRLVDRLHAETAQAG